MSDNEFIFEEGNNGNKIFTVFDVDGQFFCYIFINSELEYSEIVRMIKDKYNESFGTEEFIDYFEESITTYKGINKAEFIYDDMRFIQGEEYDK